MKANAAIVPAGTNGAISVYATNNTDVVLDINGYFVPASITSALAFYPLTPCRVADTRNATGSLGGPSLVGMQARSFPMLASACNIPSSAQAYSLNFTALPQAGLGYLSAYPAGQAWPGVSTLNVSPNNPAVANAAIVPAGTGGAINVLGSNNTDVVIDINGYFAPVGSAAGSQALYTVTPCRVLDTRSSSGSFNGALPVNVTSSSCGIPSSAEAFVLNATVIPTGGLGYLTLWPENAAQPWVSTLNADDGVIASNLAIVPTTNGSIDAFSSSPTQLILDISGYFAPSSSGPQLSETIAATSGGGQSVTLSTALAAPLVATVTQSGVGVSGVAVTFTAPATGASGKFTTSGSATETDITNANGVATSSVFTANSTAGPYTVSATTTGATGTANFSLTNTAAIETIAATSGGGQSVTLSTAFASPLVATVTHGGVGVSGVAVTFTAPAKGASGKFTTSGTATETDTTNANGVATSSEFTANSTAGPYTVSVTATGATGPANFTLTNLAAKTLTPGNYVFSLSGTDTDVIYPDFVSYSVSGVFTVGPDGATITGGEQDLVDYSYDLRDPVPGAPAFTGTVCPSGDGTGNLVITLNTEDSIIGPGGK